MIPVKWVNVCLHRARFVCHKTLFDPIKIITPYMISISLSHIYTNLFSMKMSLTQLPLSHFSYNAGPVAMVGENLCGKI